MAQKVLVEMVDDLDGSEADETVLFTLDGIQYEIDLSKKNSGKLRKSLEKYLEHARRTGGRKRSRGSVRPGSTAVDREQNQAIRAWARKHGHEIADRGRIPSEIVDAFHAQAKSK